MPRKTYKILGSILAMTTMVSCSSIDCSVNSLVECVCGFRDSNGDNITITSPLTVVAHRPIDGNDSILINQMVNVSELSLPMSYAYDADTLTISVTDELNNTLSDNIIIKKTNEPIFESVDCGPRFHHTIQEVSSTHVFIDSVIINKAYVSNDLSKENLLIYISTSD